MAEENICKGCGAVERDFQFWMPLSVVEKAGTKQMRVGGIASDQQSPDLQGETVFVDGLETDYLMERGVFNWNHGKEPGDILGEIDTVDKNGGKLYVEGFLYPTVKQAVDTYNLMRSMKDVGSKRKLGLSIEGKIKERSGKEVRKAWLKAVAMTYNPINQGSWVDVMKSLEGHTFNKCDGDCGHCKFVEKSDIPEKVVEFLEKNPNPPDSKIHGLAESLGMKPDDLEAAIYAMLSDVITHGKGGNPDKKELETGVKVEVEHTKSKALAEWVARAHLKEFPDYYTRLKAMEDKAKAIKKAQEEVIDAREEVLDTEPAPAFSTMPICLICGEQKDKCLCPNVEALPAVEIDPRGGEANASSTEVDPRGEGIVLESAMSAGYDIPAATGGVSGSALREEDLKKKPIVTTYEEKHLGLKKFSKKDIKDMVKAYGYSDEIAERITDLIFKAKTIQVKPHMASGHPVKGHPRHLTKERKPYASGPATEEQEKKEKEEWEEAQKRPENRAYWKEKLMEGGASEKEATELTAEQLKEPYREADMEHEYHRIRTMSDKALKTRAYKITDPNKLLNFFRVAQEAGKFDVVAEIIQAGKGLGLSEGDFERGRRSNRFSEAVAKPKVVEKPTKPKGYSRARASAISDGIADRVGEKIDADEKWMQKTRYERNEIEANIVKRDFADVFKEADKETLHKIGELLEDNNWHAPAHLFFAAAGDYENDPEGLKDVEESLFGDKSFKGRSIDLEAEAKKEPYQPKLTVKQALERDNIRKISGTKFGHPMYRTEYSDKLYHSAGEALAEWKKQEAGRSSKADAKKEPYLEKAWPEHKVKGSLGHFLTELATGGQGKVRSHPRYDAKHQRISIVKEHPRINTKGKRGYEKLSSLVASMKNREKEWEKLQNKRIGVI